MTNDSTHVNLMKMTILRLSSEGFELGTCLRSVFYRDECILEGVIGKCVLGCCYSGNNNDDVAWTHENVL